MRFTGASFLICVYDTYTAGLLSGTYSVSVTLDRTSQMMSGMNAGIRIELSESDDVITVPVSALEEEDGKTYVYTSYNEKEDVLEDRQEVTTGLSDGTDVQIVSGISEGDQVCYRYADTLVYSFSR